MPVGQERLPVGQERLLAPSVSRHAKAVAVVSGCPYGRGMGSVLSVNIGSPRPLRAKSGMSGIDKRPVDGPVQVRAPRAGVAGTSGLVGDRICDSDNHGGPDQAVYAYAREDLVEWEKDLGRALPAGVFGENLTTAGVDVSGAVVGERWRVGEELVLQVVGPRIPCRTFAVWMAEPRWLRRFTARSLPGAYLRVLRPGLVSAGDPIVLESRPAHGIGVAMVFRALTLEPELLASLVDVEELSEEARARARRRAPFELFGDDDVECESAAGVAAPSPPAPAGWPHGDARPT